MPRKPKIAFWELLYTDPVFSFVCSLKTLLLVYFSLRSRPPSRRSAVFVVGGFWSWPSSAFFGRFVMLNRHQIILIGCSDGEPVLKKGVECTCYLTVGCRASAWCVRATLDPDPVDVSRPCSLPSSPLVCQHRLGVFQALFIYTDLQLGVLACLMTSSDHVVETQFIHIAA